MFSQLVIDNDSRYIIEEKTRIRAGDYVCVKDIDFDNGLDNSFFVIVKRRRYDLVEAIPTTLDKVPEITRIKVVSIANIEFTENELRQVQ